MAAFHATRTRLCRGPTPSQRKTGNANDFTSFPCRYHSHQLEKRPKPPETSPGSEKRSRHDREISAALQLLCSAIWVVTSI